MGAFFYFHSPPSRPKNHSRSNKPAPQPDVTEQLAHSRNWPNSNRHISNDLHTLRKTTRRYTPQRPILNRHRLCTGATLLRPMSASIQTLTRFADSPLSTSKAG